MLVVKKKRKEKIWVLCNNDEIYSWFVKKGRCKYVFLVILILFAISGAF